MELISIVMAIGIIFLVFCETFPTVTKFLGIIYDNACRDYRLYIYYKHIRNGEIRVAFRYGIKPRCLKWLTREQFEKIDKRLVEHFDGQNAVVWVIGDNIESVKNI